MQVVLFPSSSIILYEVTQKQNLLLLIIDRFLNSFSSYGYLKLNFKKNMHASLKYNFLYNISSHQWSFELEDILYTAASLLWGIQGRVTWHSPAYTELVEVLARATKKLSLDSPNEPQKSRSSKLDERFLSGSGSRPTRRKLPFFPDLHHKVSRSWKQPFSSRLTNAAAADFTNLVGSVEQVYATVPAVEETLAAHFSPNPALSFRPSLVGPPRLWSVSPTLRRDR